MNRIFLFSIVVIYLCSCQNSTQETPGTNMRVRTSVVSTGTGSVRCIVTVEGPDGDSVSGAVVTVSDTANRVTFLQYDSSACVYGETIEEAADTTYTFEINSILQHDAAVIKVPYTTISAKPQITVFQDENGNSVLGGQSLAYNALMQIAWSSSGENIKFLQKYFDDTASYSLCKSNRYGQEDSVGMCGAITIYQRDRWYIKCEFTKPGWIDVLCYKDKVDWKFLKT
ncbi:hypothetical protein AGMMS49991_09250 [Spirochaetia bacterium]|nr:hypothetical protein AGMMS49991_09250 [Spirochaetia bacterium]